MRKTTSTGLRNHARVYFDAVGGGEAVRVFHRMKDV